MPSSTITAPALNARSMPRLIVRTGASTEPSFASSPSGDTKIELVTRPSKPSQLASRLNQEGRFILKSFVDGAIAVIILAIALLYAAVVRFASIFTAIVIVSVNVVVASTTSANSQVPLRVLLVVASLSRLDCTYRSD